MKYFFHLLLFCLHLFLLGQNSKLPLKPKNCLPCSNEELGNLEKANSQLQLLVRIPNNETVDTNFVAIRFLRNLSYRNWFPLSAEKQTLCGLVGHYNIHSSGKENDHNLRIIPNEGFEHLLHNAEQFKEKDKKGFGNWHDCNGGVNNCMESEITPSTEFMDQDSEYFQLALNHEICAYGPWVRERLHNNRPEIHPAEVLWYKEGNSLRIMIFQDASERYDKSSRFKHINKKTPKSKSKPVWVEDTIEVAFSLYFEFENESVDTLRYNIEVKSVSKHLDQVFKKNTSEISLILKNDQLQIDGNLEGLGLDFKELVFCKEKGQKKGLLTFETAIFRVGKEYGYLVLDVKQK